MIAFIGYENVFIIFESAEDRNDNNLQCFALPLKFTLIYSLV